MNEAKKDRSDPGKSSATQKDDAETTASQHSVDDAPADSMSAEEQAMLDKIMSEIEGEKNTTKHPDDATGGASSTSENNDSRPAENGPPAAGDDAIDSAPDEDEVDFAAELEKVAREAGSVTGDAPSATSSDGPDDELDEDQQKAFENIMAQIEGGNADAGTGDTAKDEDEADFAAELEKVAREAGSMAGDAPSPTPSDGPDKELNADQQEAFESIMAQIEDSNADTESGDTAKDEAEVGFAAKPEKVAKENATATSDAPSDVSDEELNIDHQEVLEKILAEIEEEPSEENASRKDAGKSDIKNPEPTSREPTVTDAGGAGGENIDRAVDVSDDIEDILKEITSDDRSNNDAETGPADESTDHEQEDLDDPAASSSSSPLQAAIDASSEPAQTTGEADDTPDGIPSVAALKPRQEAVPLRETGGTRKTPRRKRRGVLVASLLVVIFTLVGGHYYRNLWATRTPLPPSPMEREASPEPTAAVEKPVEPMTVPAEPSDESRLSGLIEDLDGLRGELIAKQKEIEELRGYYQSGIDAEIESIIAILGREDGSARTFEDTMADQRLRLGLAAIQRRDTYIKKLEKPAHTLFLNSEELLYLSRKAGVLSLMAGKTSDIDVDGLLKRAVEVMAQHRGVLAQLNIDDVHVSTPSLKSVWQRIVPRLPKKKAPSMPPKTDAWSENAPIWSEICSGNFSRKHKLSALSPEAARCLSAWKGKDLFLNQLTTLSPEAARQLANWEGDWLGLNGLDDISPETATHLARWKGRGLSLNGLSRLSPRVVAILSEWQGEQIELVNVKHMAHWENPNTRLFLSEAMRRKQGRQGNRK